MAIGVLHLMKRKMMDAVKHKADQESRTNKNK
jgi:hypothetical protein